MKYGQLAEMLTRNDRTRLAQISAGLSYDGKPGA